MTSTTLAAVPTIDELASSPMTVRLGEFFNPPGLTNFRGTVQAAEDITAFRALAFPPYTCGLDIDAALYIDDRYVAASGEAVTFRWYPDRIERTMDHRDLRVHSVLALPMERKAVVLQLQITNQSRARREVPVRLAMNSHVARYDGAWGFTPLVETDNGAGVSEGLLTRRARHSQACLAAGVSPAADTVTPRSFSWRETLEPQQTWTATMVVALDGDADGAAATVRELLTSPRAVLDSVHSAWEHEIAALFTPGNDRYSGWLPTLETEDVGLRRLYGIAALGLAYFRRDHPVDRVRRAYATLMPRYWSTTTFIWDYALSGFAHGLLDPSTLRDTLQYWMAMDVHQHFGTDFRTGEGVGPWYSVNDYAMLSLSREYLRWTGDRGWLDQTCPPLRDSAAVTVLDRLDEYATGWRSFRTGGGLADYGGLANLLECVSSYVHEVAGMNAANVFGMRFVADLHGGTRGAAYREEAKQLVAEVNRLYARGRGFWHARFPDGRLEEVRHCYDLITVLTTMPDDLDEQQRAEMAAFWQRELRTDVWMRALSPADADCVFSIRPDHQWSGAYTAWPALAVLGLCNIDRHDLAAPWLHGLARSANQGPFSQAHFSEGVVSAVDGGARKAPPDHPYLTDWACASSGAWLQAIIEGVFGVRATLDGITATPHLDGFDRDARLRNLRHQGRLYDVDARGLHPQD
ncbi:MAG: glucosidase family protein [Candidatus Dormibacteria bacterium]